MDGGLTWKLMGLEKTQVIGRIAVHPTNPNIVYVAALGAIWNANKERGLYKTTDGGQTWELVKFVSDKAGFVDVQLDPSNPDVVWAVELRARARPVLPQVRRPRLGALEVQRCGEDVGRGQGTRLPRDDEGAHRDRHRPEQPAHHVHPRRGRHRPQPQAGKGGQGAGEAERTLSLRRRRRHLDAHERRRTRAPSITRRCACTRRIPTASTGRPRRSRSPTTAARRPRTPPSACTWTITPCGSIPSTPIA